MALRDRIEADFNRRCEQIVNDRDSILGFWLGRVEAIILDVWKKK